MRGMRNDEGYSEDPLLKGNLVIAQLTQQIYQNAINFWQNGPEELQNELARSLHKYKTRLFPKSCVLY